MWGSCSLFLTPRFFPLPGISDPAKMWLLKLPAPFTGS